MAIKITLGVLLALFVLTILITFVCFRKIFYFPKRTPLKPDEYPLVPGKEYEPYQEKMIAWIKEMRAMEKEQVEITSFDGLTLRGAYFEKEKGLPIELMFHGYEGTYERDLCCGVQRTFAVNRNALLINQRASGDSDGNICTFGIHEYKDCLKWIDFAVQKFGEDCKLILTGISMGGATVLTAAGENLPKNVIGVLADCPFSSAKDIIQKVITDMRLPAKIVYPFVKLGAKIFGKFDLEENSPMQAMSSCQVPVIFLHGDADNFVPWQMSVKLHEACQSKKKLVLIKGAPHGLAYPKDEQGYLQAIKVFQQECGE